MSSFELVIMLVSLFSGTAYTILIISFTVGWISLKKAPNDKASSIFISVIVPIRNEEAHIETLLQCLFAQDYPKELLEIIMVDDHSTDHSLEIMNRYATHPEIAILNPGQEINGKKNAIDLGISQAKGNLIVTTDADCIVGEHWLKIIGNYYKDKKYTMLAGPVAIHKPIGFLASFQALELLSLVASGAGAIGIHQPIMCNGANFSYNKEAYLEVEGFKGNWHIPGGDDMFMMEKINMRYPSGSIGFAAHPDAIAYTNASTNLKAFINQRFRWVAKSPAYRNPFLITSAVVVLLFNLILLLSLIASIFSWQSLLIFGALFILKCIIDFPLLWMASGFAKQRQLMAFYIPFQLIYFIFISLSGILGNLLSFSWKGRRRQ